MKNGFDNLPTTTAIQARVQLFQPTQKPATRRGEWVETSWGRCKVAGRLGQRHADVFEAIFYHAEKARLNETIDCYELLVDPYRIRSTMSDKKYSGAGLEKLLTELSEALVEIKTDWPAAGHLIDEYKKSTVTKHDPRTGNERPLLYIRVGRAGMDILRKDIGRWRDPAKIARLSSGISQAVARLVLSHRDGGRMKVDTALSAVGILASGYIRLDARKALKADADGLKKCGVVLLDGFVFADRHGVQPPGESENDKKYNCFVTQNGVQPPDDGVQPPDDGVQPPDDGVQPPGALDILGLLES
jgi:hypothetical protein